jgi:hypothetical protein
LWGTTKHGLVSAGLIFDQPSEPSGERTTVRVTFWSQCQCGKTFATQLTCEFASVDSMEEVVNGLMSVASVALSRVATAAPWQVSASDLRTIWSTSLSSLPEE